MSVAPTRHRAWLPIVVMLLAAAGCTRGADEERLHADLQARLDREVKPDLFEVVALRREGSAPLPAGEPGSPRVVVYFNATLRLAQDYAFGGWDQLGPSSVSFALGATEKGLVGLQTQNRAGDIVRAYGTAIYEQSGEGWVPVASEPSQQSATPNIEGSAPPPRSKQLIDKLAAMVELPPPGVPPQQDDIIAEELARASENIERRVKRSEHVFTLATGQQDGDYARFGASVIEAVNRLKPDVKLRQRHTDGSVENAWLLARGEADYALVQGDVAAAAVAGEDVFARGGPLSNLRAVGGLFPEAIHVVVLQDSPVQEIAQLRGRRVNVGSPLSGTRFDAAAVLSAHALNLSDLGGVQEDDMVAAVTSLRRRQVDAIFITAVAPIRALQELAVRPGLRLLPLKGPAREQLVHARKGLVPLTLPANTYPNQKEPISTVASVALLVTTDVAPLAEVGRVADLVYARMPQQPVGSADVVKVSAEHELRGVTIPLHPGAAQRAP